MAARRPPLPEALPAFHGQVRALLAARSAGSSRVPEVSRCGAGERDTEAIATAERLAREGYVVVMFPEGTRRTKGLRKKHVARAHTGAARIALSADVPLVPAAISGTDRLAQLGRITGLYGPPLDIDDLARARPRGGRTGGDRPADGAIIRARRSADVSVPLLVVDGDSFAHRAYHALPASIRREDGGRATRSSASRTMLLRLWQAESRARSSSAGTRSARRRTGTSCSPGYQSGRMFDHDILEQLDLLPALVAAHRDRLRQSTPASRQTTSSGRRPTRRSDVAAALVATSDRDAFQLASERTTILQPTRE